MQPKAVCDPPLKREEEEEHPLDTRHVCYIYLGPALRVPLAQISFGYSSLLLYRLAFESYSYFLL